MKRIALIGIPSSANQLALRMRQTVDYEIIKIKNDHNLVENLEKVSIDIVLIICAARNVAPSCQLISTVRKSVSPQKIIVISEVKDADLMYASLSNGVSKFLVGSSKQPRLCDQLIKDIKTLLHVNQVKRVLAIGAHPDDVEIGCGGTIKKHSEMGDEVMILTLTKGARGGNKADRQKESENAAKSLNSRLIMYDLEDTKLSNGGDTIQSIEQTIKDFNPNIIYTHSLNDTHQDHRATHYATLVAARKVKHIYAYLAPSGTMEFHPRYFEHIEEYLDDKMKAINCFTSQTMLCARPYLKTSIIQSTAEYWGRFSNYGMVEPFEVIRA